MAVADLGAVIGRLKIGTIRIDLVYQFGYIYARDVRIVVDQTGSIGGNHIRHTHAGLNGGVQLGHKVRDGYQLAGDIYALVFAVLLDAFYHVVIGIVAENLLHPNSQGLLTGRRSGSSLPIGGCGGGAGGLGARAAAGRHGQDHQKRQNQR